MYRILSKHNNNLSLVELAEEYRYLISLSVISELEANRIAKILEMANFNESLNCLIEEIEMNDYLELAKINENLDSSLQENQGLQRLLHIISEDANNYD